MSLDDDKNRRQESRAPALLRVDYPNLSGFMTDYSENISKNGLFIATEQAHKIGDVVDFQISFPGLLEPMSLRGRVCWVRPGDGGVGGIGVELIFASEASREAMARLARSAQNPDQPLEAPGESLAPERRFRVLLAEDNPHVREMFTYGMNKLSHIEAGDERVQVEVVEAADGADALEKISAQAFDLVICDIYMPVLDGREFIRRLRSSETGARTPVIVVSAGDAEAKAQALALGADIFLPKPVKLNDILVTVKSLLRLN